MDKSENTKRLAKIRATYYGGVYGNSPGAVDVPWLLDQLAAREARIAKLEAALTHIRQRRSYFWRIAEEALK